MSLKFGILGIGQCGTSIAEYAYTRGFKAVIANTAQVDLDQAKYIPSECKIYLGGRGAGRDRQVGIEAMASNGERVYNKCLEEFKDCDALFVVAAGGGGTGSGGLPVGFEILTNISKYVGAILVLPDELESPRAKMNTLECFSQLTEFPNLGSVFIIDNEKAKKLNPTISRRGVYQITNKQIIDFLVELNALTDKPSYVSNFDASDLLGIIQERGFTLISKTEYYSEETESPHDIGRKVRESWEQNYQPSFDGGQILKAAIIGKISEKLSSKVDVNFIFQETGMPYDFSDVYFQPDQKAFGMRTLSTFYTILSGLSFPEKRLQIMNEEVKNIEEKLVSSFTASQNQRFESENWSSKFSRKVVNLDTKPTTRPQKINILDKLSKFKS